MIGSEVIQRLMMDKWEAFARVRPLIIKKKWEYSVGIDQEDDYSGGALYLGLCGGRPSTDRTGQALFQPSLRIVPPDEREIAGRIATSGPTGG